MPVDASVAMSVQDNLSAAVVAMKNSMTAFRTDVVGLQKELYNLSNSKASLRIDMNAAQIELKKTRQAYRDLGESATEAERQAAKADWSQAEENLENIRQQYDLVSRQVRQTTKDLEAATGAISKLDNRAARSGGGGETYLLDALGTAGLGQMAGDTAQEIANTLISSTYGSAAGGLISSGLSGAISGAAIGSLAGAPGAAAGAAIGGALGVGSGLSQVFSSRSEAFSSYVQEAVEGQISEQSEAISSGSDTAAQRELDAIAFNRLLGEGVGDQYLSDLRDMAASTPMEYSDLTDMSRALATGFGDSPERMLELMEAIGDAGSAVGVTASDMTEMARAMSRMNSSGKATLEYLNIFQDRGVDAIGMLSEALGKTQGEIYDMISKGEINGKTAANILQQGMEEAYSGAMEQMSTTFEGLSSTLADAETELNNAYGEGYNAARKEGMEEQIDWLNSGAMEEANRAIGAWQAELENEKERYQREAIEAMMSSDEYQSAEAQGDAAEMGRLIMQAKIDGMGEYNKSEGAQLALESELALAEAIRENAQTDDAYWDAGYRKGQQYSKGLNAAIMASPFLSDLEELGASRSGMSGSDGATYSWDDFVSGGKSLLEHLEWFGSSRSGGPASSNAFGLNRVPYDNYAAILHQGERVLTAREARAMDRQGGAFGSVTVTGNQFIVRQESDIDAVAAAILRRAELAAQGGVR